MSTRDKFVQKVRASQEELDLYTYGMEVRNWLDGSSMVFAEYLRLALKNQVERDAVELEEVKASEGFL